MRSPSGEMKSGLKKGSWSHEEDELLKSYINRYGIWNWSHMPKFAGLMRSGKSCRLRWMNYLKPNVRRGKFSKEEEEIILHYHSLLGNRWSAIASQLQGRSDNEIKNYWHTHLKKRIDHITTIQTTEQHDTNLTPSSEANVAVKKQDDNAYNRYGSLFVQTSEVESPSSSGSSDCKDHEVEWKDDYYDLCSPGTIKDLQGFWKQLYPSENEDMSFESLFQCSYNDGTGPYNLYNNDCDTIQHLI